MTKSRGLQHQRHIEPAIAPTALDCAYIAGFFDGEGWVGLVNRKSRGYALLVTIGQRDPRPLLFIRERFGGTIPRVQQRGKYCFHWRCGNAIAEVFLRAIQPFLIHKREQVDLALAYRQTVNARKHGDFHAADEEYRKAILAVREKLKEDPRADN